MIIRNFYEERISQASYLVGCAATGEAIVVDPLRTVDQYLEMAQALGLRISAITETHIHADYVSGSRELAARTGAKVFLSDEGTKDWKYGFQTDENVELVRNGSVIVVGNLTLKVLHTPGHTPEHISFLLTDHPAGDEPHSLFSGDFVFVGDVGRPDLLEKVANMSETMEAGARELYRSLQSLSDLPDSLLIWPAHGAGSACGKSLGGSPVTTLGYERKTSWAFNVADEDSFVKTVLDGQPDPPSYFKEMKVVNKIGPKVLYGTKSLPQVYASNLALVDVRDPASVRAKTFVGSLVIPRGKILVNWAGWLLDYTQEITLIASSAEEANLINQSLTLIGLDIVESWIHPDHVSLPSQEFKLVTCGQIQPDDFVLDVRSENEWNEAHIGFAHHIPLGSLRARISEVPSDKRVVVHCASGARSPIAVSILNTSGCQNLVELEGGINRLKTRCSGLLN